MGLNRKTVEEHLAAAEADLKKAEENAKIKPVKKCPVWRQAKAEVKKYQGRIKALDKLATREAELKKA